MKKETALKLQLGFLALLIGLMLCVPPLLAKDKVIIDGDKITIIGAKDERPQTTDEVVPDDTVSTESSEEIDYAARREKALKEKKRKQAYQAEVNMARKNKNRHITDNYKKRKQAAKERGDAYSWKRGKKAYHKSLYN